MANASHSTSGVERAAAAIIASAAAVTTNGTTTQPSPFSQSVARILIRASRWFFS